MSGAATGGFGRTFGSIAALLVAVALAVGGYVGWGWYRRTVAAAQDRTIVTADSLQRAVQATQRAGDAEQAALRDSLATAVSAATRSQRSAQQQYADAIAQLRAQQREADSLRAIAHTPQDSVAAESRARPPSLDSTFALLARQHAADSGATAIQATATTACTVSLRSCADGRVRADSIAGFWETKYRAEAKKTPPKWQRVSVEAAKAIGVALLTKLILK